MKSKINLETIRKYLSLTLLIILAVFLLFSLVKCIYQNRTVAYLDEYGTTLIYNDVEYKMITIPFYGEQEKRLGNTQDGYRLFSIKNDTYHDFIIILHIMPLGDFYYFVKSGVKIPTKGEITAVFIKNKQVRKDNLTAIIENLYNSEDPIFIDYNKQQTSSYSVYFAYNDCPVATSYKGSFIKYKNKYKNEWYYITDTKNQFGIKVDDSELIKYLNKIS
ncbi:hypothetical protein LJB90_02590 [Eubacteriales bacterium OttesenSCG-928-G02]|nr:hypothetical protein [Eubacteriales bacterium OttesenSCG-928-G02]